MRNQFLGVCLSVLFLSHLPPAQDYRIRDNYLHPIEKIEALLWYGNFDLFRIRPSRFEGDMTKRAILRFATSTYIQVKWKCAPPGGEAFNNQPRYEVAAYELQKLFLDEQDYIVPPTALRGLSYALYKNLDPDGVRTFRNPDVVFFTLQYWLENVTTERVFDKARFERDPSYAYALCVANIFSYIVRHSDANQGNFLISTLPEKPRIFAVDNGVAFESEKSDRGDRWSRMLVDRLPAGPINRLRKLTLADLTARLETVAQFEIHYGIPVLIPPIENLQPDRGVRRRENVIQFGLTRSEIEGVMKRIEELLKRIDEGKLAVY